MDTDRSVMPIPIVGPPSAAFVTVMLNAHDQGATAWYDKALIALWRAGTWTGIDPVVLAAQCAHETGWGKFGGAVKPEFGNTCGLKVRNATGDTPADHAQFAIGPSSIPYVGALAHAHHLLLYCGFPVPDDTPDPRAVWIGSGTANFGTVHYVEDLGGRWAPASDYGQKVAAVVNKLKAA